MTTVTTTIPGSSTDTVDRYVGKIMTINQISEDDEEMYNNVYRKSLIYGDAYPTSYFIELSDYVPPNSN